MTADVVGGFSLKTGKIYSASYFSLFGKKESRQEQSQIGISQNSHSAFGSRPFNITANTAKCSSYSFAMAV